jgi:hypothetical protein
VMIVSIFFWSVFASPSALVCLLLFF